MGRCYSSSAVLLRLSCILICTCSDIGCDYLPGQFPAPFDRAEASRLRYCATKSATTSQHRQAAFLAHAECLLQPQLGDEARKLTLASSGSHISSLPLRSLCLFFSPLHHSAKQQYNRLVGLLVLPFYSIGTFLCSCPFIALDLPMDALRYPRTTSSI